MSDATKKVRNGNTLMEMIIFACAREVEMSEEGQRAHKALEVGSEKWLSKLDTKTDMEFFVAVSNLYMTYAQEMFKLGWKLRGNPDLLAELIE